MNAALLRAGSPPAFFLFRSPGLSPASVAADIAEKNLNAQTSDSVYNGSGKQMIPLEKLNNLFPTPVLTRRRMTIALIAALVSDALQIPFQLVPLAPAIIDVVAMALMIWLVGFHLLLLPTFVVEFIPLVDMLPTWTGCVIAVIALRKREQRSTPPPNNTVPPVVEQKRLPPPES